MKKMLIAVLAVASLAFVACKKEEKKTETPAETKPVEGTAPADSKAGEVKPAEGTTPPAAAGDMPAECKEYADKMSKCLESDKFPAAAKDQTKQAFEQMRSGWGNLGTMPAEAKDQALKAAGDACKQATDAMKQAGEAMCPGVW